MHANIGVEKYFFEAGDRILNRIKEVRGTAILPERTGPIADVLYSAGGNSADEHWYNRDVIAYSFETGADRYVDTTLSVASSGRSDGDPGRQPERLRRRRHDHDRRRDGERRRSGRSTTWSNPNPPSPDPNVMLTEALSLRASGGSGASRAECCSRASASSRTTTPRASTRRSSSRPATTACSSRPSQYARDRTPPMVG